MELKEFAEIILFGTNITSDKLLEPKCLTDTINYEAIISPRSPSRPKNLQFNETPINKKIPFPNQQQLDDERQRGYVLHFFANHELLAMEIMALVLLKFPDTPKSFRMGIANTIIEEQKHMKLYLKRMNELNVTFGEIPVNDFFWNCLSKMASPMEFVIKMSLTFEQANLDYALFYKELMQKIQDYQTAEILETIYTEEIGHVKHGVTWFNRWRDQKESEWESYLNHLEIPLTPARAKGIIFDYAARKKAGLSENFIKELSVYNSSKGRPPNIFYFNPASELEISRKKIGFTPAKAVSILQNDCASLMQFLAANDDVVLLAKKPDISFLQKLQKCGYPIPEFLEINKQKKEHNFINQQHISQFCPWGWSPESIHIFNNLKEKLIVKTFFQENIFSNNSFQNNIMNMYSKIYSVKLYKEIYPLLENITAILPDKKLDPIIAENMNAAITALQYFKDKCNIPKMVIKAPLGCAGQNMLRVENTELSTADKNWLEKILLVQHSVIIEPWYEKVVDLSFQAKISDDRKYIAIGSTRFLTDKKGQYKGTIVGKKTDDLSKNITKFLYTKYDTFSNIENILHYVSSQIGEKLINCHFIGPFGIDAFVYEDKLSPLGFRLKFLSELNPRYTMGRVAIEISKRIQAGAFAVWFHLRINDILSKSHCNSIAEFVQETEKRFPITLTNDNKPLIREGILFTNDPMLATSVLTVLIVGKKVLSDFTNFSSLEII